MYTVEETIDDPVPEVVNTISQEQVQNRTVNQIVAMSVSQGWKENVDFPVPEVGGPSVEVVKAIPQERLQQHTAERIVDMPDPQIWEKLINVIQLVLQERIIERFVE